MGHNPATWMLEVTGGAMTTLVPANTIVDWPTVYAESPLRLKNDEHIEELISKVRREHSL